MASQRIQFRQDTSIRWQAVNPVLAMGEPAYETDTGKQKIGDGRTPYKSLPYRLETGVQGPVGAVGAVGPAGPIGLQGIQGERGQVGAAGPANVLNVGTVAGGPTASATITGAVPAQTLNLVLPKGDTGPAGPPCALSIGAVTKGAQPSASVSGVAPNQILNLILPQGDQGIQGIQGIQGVVGPAGPVGPQGPVGAGVVVQGSITTWPPAANPADGDLWLAGATLPTGTPAGTVQGDGFVYDRPTNKWINVGQIRGPAGPQGNTGLTGPQGPVGLSNTLSIGSVTSGTNAGATLTGTAPAQVLNLVLPRGDQGIQGIQGIQGLVGLTGPAGPANSLTIGTVAQGASGTNPTATITGNSPAQTLSFTFPAPPVNVLTIGTVTQGPTAAATITGTPPNQVLNLTLPAPQITQATSFTVHPQNQSVFVGETVTLTANAQSTELNIVYKWQVSPSGSTTWTDIAGAGTSTYSFTAALADAGKRYRCVATTTSVGPVFSLVATVTVTVRAPGDGSVWSPTFGGGGSLNGVTFGANLFVNGNGLWSADGVTWQTAAPPGLSFGSRPVFGLGTFLSAQAGQSGSWYTSSDGKNWVTRLRPSGTTVSGNIVFGFGFGRFVALWSVTNPAPSVQAAHSTDGVNWTLCPAITGLTLTQITGIATGTGNSSLMVATGLVSNGPTNQYLASADGITWVVKTFPSVQSIQDITFGGTNFVAVGTGNQVFFTATPAAALTTATLTFTAASMPTTANWTGVAFGNSRFVAVAANSSTAANSANGSTWLQQTLSQNAVWSGVAFGANKFVAVGGSGSITSG